MQLTKQPQPITISGISISTTNDEAFVTIPKLWERFWGEHTLVKMGKKTPERIYAVYTNFTNQGINNEGVYTFLIGVASNIKGEEFTTVTIPASKEALFPVEENQPERVGEKWQEIWNINTLQKTFVADYETYDPDGTILIHVGIR